MASGLSIRTSDLKRLCAVVDDDAHRPERGRTLPRSVLEALYDLVPCDDITYQVMDPAHEVFLNNEELRGDIPCPERDEERLSAFFWSYFKTYECCSYPQRSGDFSTVHRATDFYSARELATGAVGELMRLQGMRYDVILPLAPDAGIDYRIIFWRSEGPDFSDREQLLLTLLRPHLAEFELARRPLRQPAVLTDRQAQLLDLVAAGMTNRQIARQLDLSDGTVRRHLENIFERLDVNSRTAAAAYAPHRATPVRAHAMN